MALNESKKNDFEIKITAVFYDKNKQKKRRFSLLHKQDVKAPETRISLLNNKDAKTLETRIFKIDTDMTQKFNTKLNALAAKLSEIKNNITEENEKIHNFKYKLKEEMENVKTEFQSLYDSAKKASDPKIKDSLEIEAIVKINDKNIFNTFTITTDSSSNMLKIKKK